MATRQSRKSTATPQQSPQVSTPSTSQSAGSSRRPPSPLSPTRISRMQEKTQLQNLNDRLAAYIDRVRELEIENSQLTRQIEMSTEVTTREVSQVKHMYEQELTEARKLIDDISREKAKIELDNRKLDTQNKELLEKSNKKDRDLRTAEKSAAENAAVANDLRTRMLDLQNRCANMEAEKKNHEDERKRGLQELRDLQGEVGRLSKILDDSRKQLENETLLRVDLENRIQSLKEENSFNTQMYEQRLTETKMTKQQEISEIDGRLQMEYEAHLQDTLQELRDQYEEQLAGSREEITRLYENKLDDMRAQNDRQSDATINTQNQLKECRVKISTLTANIEQLQASNQAIENQLDELRNQLSWERDRHAAQLSERDTEINRLNDDMAEQLKEYQELLDIKIALDLEIAAYRKLLEAEEERLHLTPGRSSTSGTPSRSTPLRGMKRKRTMIDESEESAESVGFATQSHAAGPIEIVESCAQGKFVKLKNKTSEEVSLSGWQLKRLAGENETSYKFHRSVKIEPSGIITVWSMDAGQTHEPPQNLVMKSQKWFIADKMSTTLVNSDGEEMAVQESQRVQSSVTTTRRSERFGRRVAHREGDPESPERCSIM